MNTVVRRERGRAVGGICGSDYCRARPPRRSGRAAAAVQRDGIGANRYHRRVSRIGSKGTSVGYAETLGGTRYVFPDLKTLLARATPPRSGDRLAGVAAADMTERVAAQR